MSPERMRWLLDLIDVSEVWGVGRRIGVKLQPLDIHTVQQLKDVGPSDIRSRFGVVMERTEELRGLLCLALEEVEPPRNEIPSLDKRGDSPNPKGLFGHTRAVVLAIAIYEHLKLHRLQQPDLASGESEQSVILKFIPDGQPLALKPVVSPYRKRQT